MDCNREYSSITGTVTGSIGALHRTGSIGALHGL